jgi:hypothetical protein
LHRTIGPARIHAQQPAGAMAAIVTHTSVRKLMAITVCIS